MYKYISRLNVLMRSVCFCREKHLWSSENIVRSPFKDINIPNVTILEYMWRSLDKWPDKTAVVCAVTDRKYTYSEIYKQSQAFGANLRKNFMLNDGDTVAVMLPNIPEFPTVILGILAAGGVVTTINPIYTPYEIRRQILMSDAKLIINHPSVHSNVTKALFLNNKQIPVISIDVEEKQTKDAVAFSEMVDCDTDLSILKTVKRNSADTAVLLSSSGTTGIPKIVELLNRTIVSNCEQQNTELRQYEYTTDNYQDVVLANLPWFHAYGLSPVMFHKMSAGLKLVSIPTFKPNYFLQALEKHKCNLMYLAPPTVNFLATFPGIKSKHLDSLRFVTVGAAPLAASDAEQFLNKIQHDINFGQVYGLTEATFATMYPKGFKDYTACGVALPNVMLRIVDDNLKNLGPNEEGELLIKGPNVMKGYKNNKEKNKQELIDGWFKSGDRGTIDQNGVLKIVDRIKDLIKVKGFQVAPAELENVIKEHPGVFDAAVVGVPDRETGERPKAFVVLNKDASADAKNIIEYVSKRVAPYKQIKEVEFVEIIPKSSSGKILKRLLFE